MVSPIYASVIELCLEVLGGSCLTREWTGLNRHVSGSNAFADLLHRLIPKRASPLANPSTWGSPHDFHSRSQSAE